MLSSMVTDVSSVQFLNALSEMYFMFTSRPTLTNIPSPLSTQYQSIN